MKTTLYVSSLLLVILNGCIPAYYRASLPASGVEAVPAGFFDNSSEVLAIPYWLWTSLSKYGFGPPVTLPGQDLSRFPKQLKKWRGFEIIDVFHPLSKAPIALGVVLIGSNGAALRLRFSYESASLDVKGRYFWEKEVSTVGPQIKTALVQFLNRNFDSNSERLVFGLENGEILGELEAFEAAAEFVTELEAGGDDMWRPAGRKFVPW